LASAPSSYRDHQQTKANDVRQRVRDLVWRARIGDAHRHAVGDAKALLDLTQNQNAAIRGKQTAVELRDNLLVARPGGIAIETFMAGVAFLKSRRLASITKSYAKSAD
jgi:hypothetical protein